MDGYACTGCDARTINERTAKEDSNCPGLDIRAHLQCWNKCAAPKYWTVTVPGESMPSVASNSGSGILSFCVAITVSEEGFATTLLSAGALGFPRMFYVL